jgi:hypothetical protein
LKQSSNTATGNTLSGCGTAIYNTGTNTLSLNTIN